MPVHDWGKVPAGIFHDFHSSWITHLKEGLNAGVLPRGYYAMSEQVVSRRQGDVLTLGEADTATSRGGHVVTDTAPAVGVRARPARRIVNVAPRRRRIVVRHISDKRVVAVIEIVSPANKDRRDSVAELAGKIVDLLLTDVQVLLIDLFPRGRADPRGMHGAVWAYFDRVKYQPPPEIPFILASYHWDDGPEVFLESLGVGERLPDMPLFLSRERYVLAPLERTYMQTYRAIPADLRAEYEAAMSNGAP